MLPPPPPQSDVVAGGSLTSYGALVKTAIADVFANDSDDTE